MIVLIVINTLIFITLSAIHFYWALGGKRAWGPAVPTKPSGEFLFLPTPIQTFLVAVGLLLFAGITVANTVFPGDHPFKKFIQYSTGLIAVIFIVRAIGDFRYLGFTKRIRNTPFARNDTKLYAPLCVLVAILSALIALS